MNGAVYLNFYPRGVGGLVGYAYSTESEANASASPARIGGRAHRISTASNLPSDLMQIVAKAALRKGVTQEQFLMDAVQRAAEGVAPPRASMADAPFHCPPGKGA